MEMTGKVLVLFCVGLAVVPGVQSINCTSYHAYNYLNDFLHHDKCESADMVFKHLHDITWNQNIGDCRGDIINKLANHYGTQAHTADHCQCTGTFKLQNYGSLSDLTHTCLQHQGYAAMYYQFFTSDHQPQNLTCRTHHLLWTHLREIKGDWHCQVDIVNHIFDAFSHHGDTCTCSEKNVTTTASPSHHQGQVDCHQYTSYRELEHLVDHSTCMSANTVWNLLDELQVKNHWCRYDIQHSLAQSYSNVSTNENNGCMCTSKQTLTDKQRMHHLNNGSRTICRQITGSTYIAIERDLFTHITDHGCRNHNYLWPTLAGVTNICEGHNCQSRSIDCVQDLIVGATLDYPSRESDSCVCTRQETTTLLTMRTTTTATSPTQQAFTPSTSTTTKSDVMSTPHGSIVVSQTTVSSHNENGWESWSPWSCKITKSDLFATCHSYRQRHCLSNMATDCEGSPFETMDCDESICSGADITYVNCSLYNQYSTCEDQTSCTYFSNTPWQICADAAYAAKCPQLCSCCKNTSLILTTTTKSATQQTRAPTTTKTTKSDVTTTSHRPLVVPQTTVSSHKNGWESWSSWTCKITKSDLFETCHRYRQRNCLSNIANDCEGSSFETMDCHESPCSGADITYVNCNLYNQYSCEDQIACTYFSNTPWQICADAAYVAKCPRLCGCCATTTSPITTATHTKTSTTTPVVKPLAVTTTVASTSTTMTQSHPTTTSSTTPDQTTATSTLRTADTIKTQTTDTIISTTIQQSSSPKPDIFGVCNFDDDTTCVWTQSNEDSFDWSLQSGPTLTEGTGPNNDHTLQTSQGKYLFVETSAPRLAGEQASLLSPILPSDQTFCLEFWYYMFGDGIGSLLVHAEDAYSKTAIELFKKDGNQGERWFKASVTILRNQIPNNYRLVITGNVGSTYTGDTAIDDLALNDGACKDSMATSTHAATPSTGGATAVTLTTFETSTLGAHTTEIHKTTTNQGQWSEWFNTKCSATCGYGTQHKVRFCSTGQNADCIGSSTDVIPCNEQNCIQPASAWSEWFYGVCSVTCGDGRQQKFRLCSTGNAMDCLGSQSETVSCSVQACPAEASLPQCNHTCTQDAVILSTAVKHSKTDNCSSALNEALPMVCCNMGDHQIWTKGAQVQPNQVCIDGIPPPYTPIAAYNGVGLVPDSAGIFYGCIRDGQSGFRMVLQTCDHLPHLLYVDGTAGKDPNTFFTIY